MSEEVVPSGHASEFDGTGDPRSFPYGIFVSDETGFCLYRWYADSHSALRWYTEFDLLKELMADAEESTRQQVRDLAARTAAAGLGIESVVDELNALSEDLSAILWHGTFDELATGDTEHAWETRGLFRAGHDDGRNEEGEPITAEEREDFALHVYNYNL